MSNFFLLKFDDNNQCIDAIHLTDHANLLQHLNDGYRMASQQEWEWEDASLQKTQEEISEEDTEEGEEVSKSATEVPDTSGKSNWKPRHLWLMAKLEEQLIEMHKKFVDHENDDGVDLSRAQAIRMAHELHLMAGKVADAIISKKPVQRTPKAKYEEGDEVTCNVLINGLDDQCSGLAGRKMVRLLWDAHVNKEEVNAIEFIAKAYSHNDGKGNPFKGRTGYIARINAAWIRAGIPAAIDCADLNNICLRICTIDE